MLQTLGIHLRNRRKELHLTQTELALLADISVRTLRDIEHGSDSPSVGAVANVCKVVGFELQATMSNTSNTPVSGDVS